MLHVSMAVAMMLPPTPRDATRKPITWQMVVDMVCARGAPREPQADGALQPLRSHQQSSCSYQMLSIEGCLLKVFLQDSPVSLLLPRRFVPAGLEIGAFVL